MKNLFKPILLIINLSILVILVILSFCENEFQKSYKTGLSDGYESGHRCGYYEGIRFRHPIIYTGLNFTNKTLNIPTNADLVYISNCRFTYTTNMNSINIY